MREKHFEKIKALQISFNLARVFRGNEGMEGFNIFLKQTLSYIKKVTSRNLFLDCYIINILSHLTFYFEFRYVFSFHLFFLMFLCIYFQILW